MKNSEEKEKIVRSSSFGRFDGGNLGMLWKGKCFFDRNSLFKNFPENFHICFKVKVPRFSNQKLMMF